MQIQNRHQLRRSQPYMRSLRLIKASLAISGIAMAMIANADQLNSQSMSSPPLTACVAMDSEALVSLIFASALLTTFYVFIALLIVQGFIVPWFLRLLDRKYPAEVRHAKP